MWNRQRGAFDLVMLIIGLIALAGVVTIATVAWHSFTERYRDEGRKEVTDKYRPVIDECEKRKLASAACVDAWLAADRDRAQATSNFNGCQASAKVQSDAVAAAEQRATDAQATTRRILTELAKRSEATAAEIAKLRQIAATPAPSRKEACDQADAVLSALASRRMRWNPDGPAPSAGGADGNGQGADARPVRIRQ